MKNFNFLFWGIVFTSINTLSLGINISKGNGPGSFAAFVALMVGILYLIIHFKFKKNE